MNLIEFIKKDTPSAFKENSFEHIIKKCMEYFHADYCSYLAPDFSEKKWQIKTLSSKKGRNKIFDLGITIEIENEYFEKRRKYPEPEIWSQIKAGICNVALCQKKAVYVQDVNIQTVYQYVKQNEDIQHEMAIPLILEHEGSEIVIGCIILDFCALEQYESAKTKVEAEQKNFEKDLGNYVYTKIHLPASNTWKEIIFDVSRLRKIDFDNPDETQILNDNLSNLWPQLIYYSVWIGTTEKPVEQEGKTFVRVASFFSNEETNANYGKAPDIMDYIFSEGEANTYGKLLKEAIASYKRNKHDIIQRRRISYSDHVPIHKEFREYLYGTSDTIRDLHFVPLIEKVVKDNEIISCILVFYFEDLGDPQVVKREQIEQLSLMIYDRIRSNRYIKSRELQKKIQESSKDIFDDFRGFIQNIGKELLKCLPSELIEIWISKYRGIESYSVSKDDKTPAEAVKISDDKMDYITKTCLSDERISRKSHINDPNSYPDVCSNCPVMKNSRNYKSCMAVKVLGPKENIRAIVVFFNRINPVLNDKVQAFSILDENSMKDVARLLGLILSLYDAREEEKKLKTILPHEFASPVSSLSHKLKDIEEIFKNILPSVPQRYETKSDLLLKKISDCWLSCDSISYNSENYIKFSKKDTWITPEKVNLYQLMNQILHLFSNKFNELKQIYILIERLSVYQELNCDKSMLFSTLHNIFDNAYKYSHRYTVFKIEVKEDAISFLNYGIGIDQNELSSVFELHYQSKNISQKLESEVQRSHGIGLALAKWYIEDCHKGEIFFNKSKKIAAYNPFFLYMVKNIFSAETIYNSAYKDNEEMLYARVDEKIRLLIENEDVINFFKTAKPLGTLGEFLFKHILEVETFENELVLILPKRFRG